MPRLCNGAIQFAPGLAATESLPESEWRTRPLPIVRKATRSAVGSRGKIIFLLIALSVLCIGFVAWLQRTEHCWRNPIADARFQTVTDFDGLEQSATISPDGQLIAFLSDRDMHMDIWITQVGSGEFHNLTHGSVPELGNPSIRALGFSPDGALVTYWLRKAGGSNGGDIGVWAVPVLGGEPRPYLPGVAEFDWTRDGTRLAYHTPGPGDPLFVSKADVRKDARPIFAAAAGLHSHFPLWAPDAAFLYFVQGDLPDKLDIWRIRPAGGSPERITFQDARVTYPVLLDQRKLLYLAGDPDGTGQGLYEMDVERRVPHRLTSELDQFTSLAASADGHRLVVTRTTPIKTFWRLHIAGCARRNLGAGTDPLNHHERFRSTVWSGLPSLCICHGERRKHLETCQR